MIDPTQIALAYHERTKHHLSRYARSLGYLDWETQPNPFRTFDGAPLVTLPLAAGSLTTLYSDLYRPGAVAARPLDLESVAILFELSLGLSAWKAIKGSRWALRCNPSSGNLHPTEGYAIIPEIPGLPAGVYHYRSREHALERRATLAPPESATLSAIFGGGGLAVGLSSVHWREAWKYGERAFRYCQHDIGHAVAAIRYAAASLGWSARLMNAFGDADVSALLGLDRDEDFRAVAPLDREHPDAILLLHPAALDSDAQAEAVFRARDDLVRAVRSGRWQGRPNALSSSHTEWEVIDEVALATRKPTTEVRAYVPRDLPALRAPAAHSDMPASSLIRARRSAVAMDGETSIEAEAFFAVLDKLLPRPGVPPWDAIPWEPHIHAGIFVHRVRGLEPGLYAFERFDAAHDRLRAAVRPEMLWEPVAGCPPHLRLFLLMDADLRDAARVVSCHQEIAADGAFSLGMIADFGGSIRREGASWYRRLFWEAGVLGHALYLEAEALSEPERPVRSTGIGCYFDDAFHELLGIEGDAFQSLYHFTVGGPVDDPRLTTLPPYAHRAPSP